MESPTVDSARRVATPCRRDAGHDAEADEDDHDHPDPLRRNVHEVGAQRHADDHDDEADQVEPERHPGRYMEQTRCHAHAAKRP